MRKEKSTFNWDKDKVYLSDKGPACCATIGAMCEAISLGHTLRQVLVVKNNDESITIINGRHRTASSYIMKSKLDYVVVAYGMNIIKNSSLEDLELSDGILYPESLVDALDHLPKKTAENFLQNHFSEYLES